jgi:hypothetical protein
MILLALQVQFKGISVMVMVNGEETKFLTKTQHYMNSFDGARVIRTEKKTALGVKYTTFAMRKLNDGLYEVQVETYTEKTLGQRGRTTFQDFTISQEQLDVLKEIM